MEEIFKALYTRAQETLLPALVEGFFFMRAPQDTAGNYITFAPIAAMQDYDMSSRLEDVVIQIRVYTDDSEGNEGPTAAVQIADIVTACFDDCTLTIPGWTLVRIDRESHNLIADPDGGWLYQIDYRLLVQDSLFHI